MMVGRDLESFYARDYCDMDKAEVALEVKNLSQTGVFEDISFSVHKGEILGFSVWSVPDEVRSWRRYLARHGLHRER